MYTMLLLINQIFLVLTFELEAAQRAQRQRDAAHVAGLGNVGEAGRGQLVSQTFGHAGVTQRLVHQHQREHLQQAVLNVLLQLGDLPTQVVQHSRQCGTKETATGITYRVGRSKCSVRSVANSLVNLPEANSQHGLQQLLDVRLDAGAHGPGQHADAGKHCGINLHCLLPPA